jgi:hypothetical protein
VYITQFSWSEKGAERNDKKSLRMAGVFVEIKIGNLRNRLTNRTD